MDGLEKLSIVIPTYGRQGFVKRQIEYWSGSTTTVFIMDGSPQALLLEHGEEFASNIRYIHSRSDFFSRMEQATKLIKTPYVALLGDDDLFAKSGLRECVSHLERNKQIRYCTNVNYSVIDIIFSIILYFQCIKPSKVFSHDRLKMTD